ncbi:class I SAM-dependent methyltransferase [Methylolobus aquaticus]
MSASSPSVSPAIAHPTVEEFFESAWAAYAAILDNNYMCHREIFDALGSCLASHYHGRPFSLIDLGCGDARFIAEALKGTAVNRYVGYDIADTALVEAGRQLGRLPCTVELREMDLMDALRFGDERFDVVFTSFAVHHLETSEKAEFFRQAARRVAPGGLLVMIDVMRAEGEDRIAYLQRYIGRARAQWTNLTENAIDAVCCHIDDRDFPEAPSTLTRMAADAGFGAPTVLPAYCDHHTLIWQLTDAG